MSLIVIVNEGVCCFALVGVIVEEVRGELNRALSRKCWGFVPRVAGGFRDRDREAVFRVAFMAPPFSRCILSVCER